MSVLPSTTYANPTTPYFASAGSGGGSASNWSTFRAVSTIDASGNAITNILSLQIDAQVLTANASSLFLNGVAIATIPDISNVEDWALYPALANVDMSGFNLSGAGAGSFTSLTINGVPVSAGSASNWATFGAVTDINVSGNAINAAASVQVGNRTLTTAAGTANAPYLLLNGSNILSNWSSFTAGSAVSMGMNDINNAKDINASGTTLTNAVTTNNLTLSTAVITTQGPNVLVNGLNSVSNWASFQANASLDMAGYPMFHIPEISISGNTQNVALTASGTQLLVDGQPVFTGTLPPSDTSNWANYPAVANVNMSGKNILGNGDLGISANNISMSALSNIYLNQNATTQSITMTGNITQCNAGAGSNFFQSQVQVGVNGVLPTDNLGSVAIYGGNVPGLLSSLYVEGGTTLDGGDAIHGITIGTLPVLGVNTQRIDVLPVGIEMTTPTFITMNGLGAMNVAMGGAIALAAGSYIALEHAAGLGANGIFVQNAADDSNCKMIFTNGGTLYNATEVQTSNIVNPLGVRFYDGVYNPSGGSIIVPAVYGRAIVDGSASSYLATLTGGDLPATKNTNSVFIGNLTNLSTGGATSTIAIGDTDGMTGQGANSIAIGKEAGSNTQGANSIAIGWEAGQETQGSNSVAVGVDAGFDTQGTGCVAIGATSGLSNQGNSSVAIGQNAGYSNLGSNSVAVGAGAAGTNSGTYVTAIGYNAGAAALGSNSIAIGAFAGSGGMGEFSTYIGTSFVVEGAVPTKTIVLNNTGTALNPANSDAFYVAKLRSAASSAGFNIVAHNNGTGEFIQTLTSSLSMDSTISNTQRISYDTGLLTTQIDGLLKVAGGAEFTQAITANTTLNVLGLTTLSSLVIQNLSAETSAKSVYYNPSLGILTQANAPTAIVAAPAFVYYVSTNGRVGGSGSITDPLSTINEALAKTASVGAVDPAGMTIYVAVGSYTEDVVVPISLTLPAVSIIGMADDTDDSKRVQIRGSVSISASNATLVNSVNTVILNNLAVFAKNASTSAVSVSGKGIRVYLKNGLYTNQFASATVPVVALSSTGVTATTVAQLVIDNTSLSMDSALSTGDCVTVSSGQLFEVKFSDLTNRGTGKAVGVAAGAFSTAANSSFISAGAVFSIVQSAATLTSVQNCLIQGVATSAVALITLGVNAYMSILDSQIQNTNATETNNTTRYIYTTSATGNLVSAVQNTVSALSAATQITPFQAAVPAATQLFFFGNVYANSTNTLVGNMPTGFAASKQFSNDLTVPALSVVATSGTAIALSPTLWGRTYVLTGTTIQAFSTAGLGTANVGFFVIVHNGNASLGGDINITGASGTTIIHNRTATQNGGILYLYWTGAALVGY